jgi:hypothetical protein
MAILLPVKDAGKNKSSVQFFKPLSLKNLEQKLEVEQFKLQKKKQRIIVKPPT